MSVSFPTTPQRNLPGAFSMTPAPVKETTTSRISQPFPLRQPSDSQSTRLQKQGQHRVAARPLSNGSASDRQSLDSVERAAVTINATLTSEAKYPELDAHVSQGISSNYDTPKSPAWVPYQKIKSYEIPEKIFEQYNRAQVSTMMGLFPGLNYAWTSIDNSLYLWDFKQPNPDLVGFEDQPSSITAVKLVAPRAGVFVSSIAHLLVMATTTDIHLLGVALQEPTAGITNVSLYQTRMQTSVKGIDVSCIEGSRKWGRIFFAGHSSNDVYELSYQQEEKWFASRCSKINHTSKGISSIIPSLTNSLTFNSKDLPDSVVQMSIDDTRNLLYSLSAKSSIRVFHIKPGNALDLVIERSLKNIMNNIGHMIPRGSELLRPDTKIVAIDSIPATEASKLSLVASTSTGCRIIFSITSDAFYSSDTSHAPSSMQVHHVKFPPSIEQINQANQQAISTQLSTYQELPTTTDISSKALCTTRLSKRFPPGYFFYFVQKQGREDNDILFVTAPDSGRNTRPQEAAQVSKFSEQSQWMSLDGRAEDLCLVTAPFSAASTPTGFANELAVQFDQPATEIAVLTNTGVQTIRRRRLVDIFASIIRYGGGNEGLEGDLKKFVRMYGRGETSATALAVACGQGLGVVKDSRTAKVTDPDVIEQARKAFIDYGGKPMLNENLVLDRGATSIDNVRPSPRHEGIALYLSRLLRSIWRLPVLREAINPQGGLVVLPAVSNVKLERMQKDLDGLREFLETNKSFIDGLASPEVSLSRVTSQQEELAIQGEHLALISLTRLLSNAIEGLSFVRMLFDERVEEILLSIENNIRLKVRELTFEKLFSHSEGKEIAKELVKAIVNRNIDKGSNVDTIADSLRRRCGNFCSSEDVIIFKAQELLKRASQLGASSEAGRRLLNDSLKLLEKAASTLTMEHLNEAVEKYISMSFFAGAIKLALKVAQEMDRENAAVSWLKDGCPEQDIREKAFESRKGCYRLVQRVITTLDEASKKEENKDPHLPSQRQRTEAYEQINESSDEVFQSNLYDWYLTMGWNDRLLDVRSPFVVTYLRRKSTENITHADLLWRYFARCNDFIEAAKVQVQLAKSGFVLPLQARLEYLSKAKTNASTRTVVAGGLGLSRQSRQELVRDASDLLEIGNIQDDILQRMKSESRLTAERRPLVLQHLDGQILPVSELYNVYADQANYYDICLLIYQVAQHRNVADIRATWQNLLETTHNEALAKGDVQPYEVIGEQVRELGMRLNLSESIFPISILLTMLFRYYLTQQREVAPVTWPMDVFLSLSIPYEMIVSTLETIFVNSEAPFTGRNRRLVAENLINVIRRWYADTALGGGLVLGGEDNIAAVSSTLRAILSTRILDDREAEEARILTTRLDHALG